ncbi:hypothetical protein HZA98_02085 [Candidatus Woesearchaeota archaeon]|nr:hypothetical protein [Candidatus Woesearchaeota archaeon]
MAFVYRLPLHGAPQGRIYVHRYGEELYGHSRAESKQMARASVLDIVGKNSFFQDDDLQYMIALLWGDARRNQRVADIFGYSDIVQWNRGNPDVHHWQFRNEELDTESHVVMCGDGSIILGMEELHRRKTANRNQYLSEGPSLDSSLLLNL